MRHTPQGTLDGLKLTILDAPGPEWPSAADLGPARCTVFQTREFIEAWRSSFGTDTNLQPLFVRVEDGRGQLVALLPLCIRRHRAVRILSFLDQGQADYNAPVLFEAGSGDTLLFAPAFWRQLVAALPPFDVALFEKLPERVGDCPNPFLALGGAPAEASGHGNLLTRSWPEVEAVLPSPKELRSKLRGLEKLGKVELVIAQDGAMRRRLLDSLIAQKGRWFAEVGLPGFAGKPLSLAFLEGATENFAASGSLMLCGLLVGGEVTAVQWGLRQGTVFYGLLTSFEAGKWTKLSCGRVLNWLLLQRLHQDGFSYFDQGYGDEPYKLTSCDTTIPLITVEIGRTWRGRLSLQLRRLHHRLEEHPLWARLQRLRHDLGSAKR
jgi:CelD/BcsL family acetyltransferase involved in cellulose biosynthesis